MRKRNSLVVFVYICIASICVISRYAEACASPKLDETWTKSFGGAVTSMTSHGSRIFVASTDGTIRALGAYNGREIWSINMGDHTGDPASFANEINVICNTIIAGDATGPVVVAFDIYYGYLSWKQDLSTQTALGNPLDMPSLKYRITQRFSGDDACYAYVGLNSAEASAAAISGASCCSSVGAVVSIYAKKGTIAWVTSVTTLDISGGLLAKGSPAVVGENVCFSTGPVQGEIVSNLSSSSYTGNTNNQHTSSIVCLDRANGKLVLGWSPSAQQVADIAGFSAEEEEHFLEGYDPFLHGFDGSVATTDAYACAAHDTGALCCARSNGGSSPTCISPFGYWSDFSAFSALYSGQKSVLCVRNGGSGTLLLKMIAGGGWNEMWSTQVHGDRVLGQSSDGEGTAMVVADGSICKLFYVCYDNSVTFVSQIEGCAYASAPLSSEKYVLWSTYDGATGTLRAFRKE